METRSHVTSTGKRSSIRRIALLSILIALCYVGRIAFQFVPNVQPMTTILLIIVLNLGLADGIIVTTASLLLSNIVLGFGPWTLSQLISYVVIMGFTSFVMRPLYRRKNKKYFFAGYAFLTGILYGFIISILTMKMFGMASFWPYYLLGLPYDLLHGFGNAGFFLLLEPIIAPLLRSQIQR